MSETSMRAFFEAVNGRDLDRIEALVVEDRWDATGAFTSLEDYLDTELVSATWSDPAGSSG